MVKMTSFPSFIWFWVDSVAILIVTNTQYPTFHGDHVGLRFFYQPLHMAYAKKWKPLLMADSILGLYWKMDGPELKHFSCLEVKIFFYMFVL